MTQFSQVPEMDKNVERRIAKLCLKSGYKIAAAESCTGGLIGHRITNQPGSSAYFLGSVVAYDYSIKRGILKVKPDTLDIYGAVSKETALEMAAGTRTALSNETPRQQIIGISVTGIAGPDGGTVEKPVGLVWIGVSCLRYEKAISYTWDGTRLQNKKYSTQAALNLLLETLQILTRYQEVQVQAKINLSGRIDPQFILIDNQAVMVTDIGRRWQDELGSHMLVMIQGNKTVELVSCANGEWIYRVIRNPARFG